MQGGSFIGLIAMGVVMPALLAYFATRRIDYAVGTAMTIYGLTLLPRVAHDVSYDLRLL